MATRCRHVECDLANDDFALQTRVMALQTAVGLSGQKARLLVLLYGKRRPITHEELAEELWPDRDPPLKGLHVLLSQTRARLRPYGFDQVVTCLYRTGYVMTDDARAKIETIFKQQQQGRAR